MRFRLLEWWRRWRETLRHGDDSQVEDELRFDQEMAELDALRKGEDVREARLRAGGVAQAAEAVRDQRTVGWLSDFLRDSRHGIRLLRRSPLFTMAAIVWEIARDIGYRKAGIARKKPSDRFAPQAPTSALSPFHRTSTRGASQRDPSPTGA